jgi:hypothetical protein
VGLSRGERKGMREGKKSKDIKREAAGNQVGPEKSGMDGDPEVKIRDKNIKKKQKDGSLRKRKSRVKEAESITGSSFPTSNGQMESQESKTREN